MRCLLEDAQREPRSEGPPVVGQRSDPEDHEGITDVDRHRDAVDRVQRGTPAPFVALVLDVVVHQECVVQQLERHGRRESLVRAGAERPCGGQAEARAEHAPPPPWVIGHQVVQVTLRRAGPEILAQRHARAIAVVLKEAWDEIARHRGFRRSAR